MSRLRKHSDLKLAMGFLASNMLLSVVLVLIPMLSNIQISFFDMPLSSNSGAILIGLSNYLEVLSDSESYRSLGSTVAYTFLVVAGNTVLGLTVAILLNHKFRFRKTVRSPILLSYVTPSIPLIFAWRYMLNNSYEIVNGLLVDRLQLSNEVPLWFDQSIASFFMVVLFAIWRYYPYAFTSFLAILQAVDRTLYEAAEMSGAGAWQKLKIVTLPTIKPVLVTVTVLRSIWMFYVFTDVYLLTNKVSILGVYLYQTAFAFNDLGKAVAISILLFIITAAVVSLSRRKVDLK